MVKPSSSVVTTSSLPQRLMMRIEVSTVVPTGRNGDGLPVGIQIVANACGDRRTIQVAQALERQGFAFEPPPLDT